MFKTLISSAACILGLLCSSASAQETPKSVSSHESWYIFAESEPKECWTVSLPSSTENTRDGKQVKVRRSAILLMVFYNPNEKVKGQVAFTGGYKFANERIISLDIDGVTYELFATGEWAWLENDAQDAKILPAMKRGNTAIITAQSERGTVTKDTFSLKGFTAAVEDAEKRCAG
tara:strand:- start:1 stop:525 length:525 start_codon:yes stop_codon:yes gene_type:complete